jgi:hypothetical protein
MKNTNIRNIAGLTLICGILLSMCVGCPHNSVVTSYIDAENSDESFLQDDSVEGKNPEFIPDLIDSRPLDVYGRSCRINKSASVIGLDVPGVIPDEAGWMNILRPSYADVAETAKKQGKTLLPSVNMINGKAKQFDDGLYACMDLVYYHGIDKKIPSFPNLMQRLYDAVKNMPEAAAYISAGLSIADIKVEPVDARTQKRFLREFENKEVASKPIGFYTWNDELKTLFRFFRFFQQRIDNRRISDEIAAALLKDEALRKDYETLLAFYAGLTNPFIDLSCADLIDEDRVSDKPLSEIAAARGLPPRPIGPGVCILPYSGSTEVVLFEKIFPEGVPHGVNLMNELISRIRSGKVNLAPTRKSGWYEHQVYALETLLLPEKGPESQKLCMTARYKKRTMEAFKALITKTRETHVRQLSPACSYSVEGPSVQISPRLRLEPAPSFYLRTARSYAFVDKLITAALGKDTLHELNRMRENGHSDMPLDEELRHMKKLFYGFYLVCCEDIGLKPDLADGEVEKVEETMKAALNWLGNFQEDPDLACDTRVSVPIYVDLPKAETRLWATLGVRLANLKATFEKPPSVRLDDENGEWRALYDDELEASRYVIPVDEFAEVVLPRLGALSREELRKICDREKTRGKIIEALQE